MPGSECASSQPSHTLEAGALVVLGEDTRGGKKARPQPGLNSCVVCQCPASVTVARTRARARAHIHTYMHRPPLARISSQKS